MLFTYSSALVLAAGMFAAAVSAQQPPPSATRQAPGAGENELAHLSSGWTLLAEGRAREAAAVALAVLTRSPRSGAALGLALEAAFADGGATAAMDTYERWLGQRRLEEPFALRRLALGSLRELTTPGSAPALRAAALDALRRDGDPNAAQELARARTEGSAAATRALAALGDASAVTALMAEMKVGAGRNVLTIEALGTSGNPQAIEPIAGSLEDERSEVRAVAAEALGTLGAVAQTSRLRTLLADRNTNVRIKAAGALLRLKDASGVPLLQELAAHALPGVRLAAAEALAHKPDAAWMTLVDQLIRVPDPEVQIRAAKLLAPHDPARAAAALESLQAHENAVIRELASQASGDVVTDDLTTLRRLLRNSHALTRVRASDRILALTR